MIYLLTLKDGSVKKCSIRVLDRFPKPGHSFTARLLQFQQVFPRAGVVDWMMDEANDISAIPEMEK